MNDKVEVRGDGNIVIQHADNSEIVINLENPKEIRDFLINFQQSLSNLPKEIIELMESKNTNEVLIEKGANVYLSLNYLINPGEVSGISLGVTITNLTKENRFFNAPFFKLSRPFEKDFDTFSMTDTISKISFPKKLEYGEVVSESYYVRLGMREIYDKVLALDENATIQAIITTTIGEIYKSNEYSVQKIVDNFKYVR